MSYTQQQLDDFWYGPGGSETNIEPGAYVTMNAADVISLTNTQSAAYQPVFAAMLAYVFQNRLYGFGTPRTLYDGTGSNGPGWGGPTRS
jgi:hypothetical protein